MNLSLKNANWSCPSIEQVTDQNIIEQKDLVYLQDSAYITELAQKRADSLESHRYILPTVQNIESIVLASRFLPDGQYLSSGKYVIESLEELKDFDFRMVDDPMIQAILKAIVELNHANIKNVILEVEAPLSILGAMINPLQLYTSFLKEGELLKDILHRIADSVAEYVIAAIDAGIRVISLADPVGTMNLVGKKYYKEFCGESECYLLKKLDSHLDGAVIHICKKMSQSMIIAGLADAYPYKIHYGESSNNSNINNSGNNSIEILQIMAEDPSIHFTGMTCIHDRKPDLHQSYIIKMN